MESIKTKEDFNAFVKKLEVSDGCRRPQAFGIGIVTRSAAGAPLDALFPCPNLNENFGTAALLASVTKHRSGTASYDLQASDLETMFDAFWPFSSDGESHPNIDTVVTLRKMLRSWGREPARKSLVATFIDDAAHDSGPQSVADAYLRLQLLSLRKVKPHGIKLDGIFGVLPNVAHTSQGPIALDELPSRRLDAIVRGTPLQVYAVDKFPRMVDYVVPSGVRIADASRVRLGAYLGEGTTVMHEGFVNFNAGTLGASMVEGRISAGVVVGDQSDVGGGASIMGTLSGGGKETVRIGRGTLLGANSGIGISLGDLCVVEAGLYITAGMLVRYKDETVKARALSGKDGLTFLRNSITGAVEALDKPNKVVLNDILHKN